MRISYINPNRLIATVFLKKGHFALEKNDTRVALHRRLHLSVREILK